MKFPRIYKGYILDYEVPENYEELVKNIDEKFIKATKNLAKKVLEEFEIESKYPYFHWDNKKGLEAIHLGREGRGAFFNKDNRKWVFKNIDESWQALAVFNIISLYLNRLQQTKNAMD